MEAIGFFPLVESIRGGKEGRSVVERHTAKTVHMEIALNRRQMSFESSDEFRDGIGLMGLALSFELLAGRGTCFQRFLELYPRHRATSWASASFLWYSLPSSRFQ
jgi:hypothetical protein